MKDRGIDDDLELLPFDTELADDARRAALAFGKIAQTLQAEAKEGVTRALVERLRSGHGLGPGECVVLADLISGELCRPVGRTTKKAKDRALRRDIRARYREVMAQYKAAEGSSRGKSPLAIKRVASEFPPITEAQVRAFVRA